MDCAHSLWLRDTFLPLLPPPPPSSPPPLFPLLPVFFLFLFHQLLFLSPFLSASPLVSPLLLHFLLSIPSRALLRSRTLSSISSFLLASSSRKPLRDWPVYGARNSDPHLRGSQFLRDPTFFPLFAFSFFASCIVRPVLTTTSLRYLSYPSSDTPFTPTVAHLAHTDSFLSSTGWSTNWLHVLPLRPLPPSLLLLLLLLLHLHLLLSFQSLPPSYIFHGISLTSRRPQALLSYLA